MSLTAIGKVIGTAVGKAIGWPDDTTTPEEPDIPFDPVSLFGVNDRGGIYDFTDSTKLFQLSGGTTAVTAPGHPIGYAADLSANNKPALQATTTLRPEWVGAPRTVGPELIVNGLFGADTDWTKGTDWTIGSGVATKVAGVATNLEQSLTLVAGKYYQIHFVLSRSAGTLRVRLASGSVVANGLLRSISSSCTDVILAGTGFDRIVFVADATFAGTIDRVTVKEVLTWTNMGARFDGVDDLMQTATIDMSNNDKLTMVASHRVGYVIGAQVILAQGNIATTTGCSDMQMSSGHVFRIRGDAATAISTMLAGEAPAGGSPQQNIYSAQFDLAAVTIATEVVARVRGVTPAQTPSGTTAGAGMLAATSALTFARGAQGTARLTGHIHRVVAINRTLTPTELVNTENWCRAGMAYCAVLGDSTVAVLSTATGHPFAARVSSMVSGIICNGADVANSGDRISHQKAAWLTIPNKDALQAVFIQIGLNDVKGRVGNGPTTTAEVIADYQDLVNTIRSGIPASCKIYACGINPCKVWLDLADIPAEAYSAWQDLNAAIAGTHPTTPITGVDGRITSHVTALADGSNNLATEYDYNNDGVHPGNAGRFVVAQAWRTQLEADGLV